MTAGHTKCICDACFWLIRLRYMRSDSQCLQHLASVVNSSASLVMKPSVCPPFTWHEWDSFKCFRGVSKYHNFRFTSVPGVIFVRVSSTAEEERISLIQSNVDLNDLLTSMPSIFNSGGLSEERKLYSVIQTCTAVKTLLAHLSINKAFSKVCKCKKFTKYGTCEFNKGFLNLFISYKYYEKCTSNDFCTLYFEIIGVCLFLKEGLILNCIWIAIPHLWIEGPLNINYANQP